jgi:DNA (cytosine-5)-methyltransferase 1
MAPIKLLDLFSGIGGFSLGLERSQAFQTVAFCEIDPFCKKVLSKHWPEVPLYEDVTTISGEQLRRDGITVEAICGGFPCQDVSTAGAKNGIEGKRSGLWSEFARLISEIRPRYVIVENVPGLLARGMDTVLGDLAEIGYDAEWESISAASIGAPHIRERVWIVAYPQGIGFGDGDDMPESESSGGSQTDRKVFSSRYTSSVIRRMEKGGWPCEPAIHRVAHGVSNRMDRTRALGNAVVPQIPEIIGLAIKKHEEYYTKRLDT